VCTLVRLALKTYSKAYALTLLQKMIFHEPNSHFSNNLRELELLLFHFKTVQYSNNPHQLDQLEILIQHFSIVSKSKKLKISRDKPKENMERSEYHAPKSCARRAPQSQMRMKTFNQMKTMKMTMKQNRKILISPGNLK